MKKEIAIPFFVLAAIVAIVLAVPWLEIESLFHERHKIEKVSEATVTGKERTTLLVSKIFIGVDGLDDSQYSVQLTWENGNATTPLFQSEEFIAFKIPHPLISPELSVIFRRDGKQKTIPLDIDDD